jgi:hypothetical protein
MGAAQLGGGTTADLTTLLLAGCMLLLVGGLVMLTYLAIKTRSGSIKMSAEVKAGPMSAKGKIVVEQQEEVDRLVFESAYLNDYFAQHLEGGELAGAESETESDESRGGEL